MRLMKSRERLLLALNNEKPDHLPATVHSWMEYFLNHYLGGVDQYKAYEITGLDMVIYDAVYRGGIDGGMFWTNKDMMQTDTWQVKKIQKSKNNAILQSSLEIETPQKTLTMEMESNEITTWITQYPVKEMEDIYIIEKFMPYPEMDVDAMNRIAGNIGDRGILRTHVFGYGQPGCWQDACCFYGTTNLIYQTYDNPEWVHAFLMILLKKKLEWVSKLEGVRIDVMELGGGDASDTVISPQLFERFVIPYDTKIIEALHSVGLRCVYHTCGGMMDILEQIKATGADGSETLTPRGMGGNVELDVVKASLGRTMFLQGGFDQLHGFVNCSVEKTKQMVYECFEKAGTGGGYIICPSDHFFDANIENVKAFGDAARECTY
jgi:uroporphyrinogen decarboxylase